MSHFALTFGRYYCDNLLNGKERQQGKKRLDVEVEDCIVCNSAVQASKIAINLTKKFKKEDKRKDEEGNDKTMMSRFSQNVDDVTYVSPNWRVVCIFSRFYRPRFFSRSSGTFDNFAFIALDDLTENSMDQIRGLLGNNTEFGNFGQHPFVKTPRPKDPHDVLPGKVEKTCWWLEAIFTHPDHPVAGYEAAHWSQVVFSEDDDDEEKEVKDGHLRSGRKRRQNDDDDEYQPSEDSESEEDDDEDYEEDDSESSSESEEENETRENLVEKKCKLESVGCVSEDGVIDLTVEEKEGVVEDDYNEQIRLGRLARFVEQFPMYYHNPANLHRDLKKVLDQLNSNDS